MPRPFNYPKDASEFRKQFCVGEYSAKKKDWMFFRSALTSNIHKEHGPESKNQKKCCVLVSLLIFYMTQFLFSLRSSLFDVIRCCYFSVLFSQKFLIDSIDTLKSC